MKKEEILNQLGGIPENVYDEIVEGFFLESSDRIRLMTDAITISNLNTIASLAHDIKGASANLRLIKIQEMAKNLEAAAKSNNIERVRHYFDRLKPLIHL